MTIEDYFRETLTDQHEEHDFQESERCWLPKPSAKATDRALVFVTDWPRFQAAAIEPIGDPDAALRQKLEERKYSPLVAPEQPRPILSLNGHVLLTPGNLANLQAQAKAGKTAALGGILAAVLDSTRSEFNRRDGDYLGFNGGDQSGFLILHLDTEQSRYDHYYSVRRALTRAEMSGLPDNFMSFSLVDLPVEERKRALLLALEDGAQLFGGVQLVAIDGIGDLLIDSNDLAASFGLVDLLHGLAVTYNCGIVTVLHENPGDGGGKARGHLGSQIERKVESNIIIRKEASGISKIWCERGRHCYIPKSEAHLFEWNEIERRHTSVNSSDAPDRAELARQRAAASVRQILASPLSYSDLVTAIIRREDVAERTAKNYIAKWVEWGLITKGGVANNLYLEVQGA